jgi:hypothetical protein
VIGCPDVTTHWRGGENDLVDQNDEKMFPNRKRRNLDIPIGRVVVTFCRVNLSRLSFSGLFLTSQAAVSQILPMGVWWLLIVELTSAG